MTIPSNSQATVFIPTAHLESVLEGGKLISDIKAIDLLRFENGTAVLKVEAGNYEFSAEL